MTSSTCRRRRPCLSRSLDAGQLRTSSSFEPLFKQCHADLRSGARKLLPFKNPSEIEVGKLFVLNGVLLYVAEMGERELDKIRKANARTRCIFENGTESDLLMQSLASNLYKDGRRVTEPNEVDA